MSLGVTGTLEHVKSSVARSGGIVLRWSGGCGAGGETRVRSPVATHLLTSLNLPVSSLAPNSDWIPVILAAEDGLEARAGCPSLQRDRRNVALFHAIEKCYLMRFVFTYIHHLCD